MAHTKTDPSVRAQTDGTEQGLSSAGRVASDKFLLVCKRIAFGSAAVMEVELTTRRSLSVHMPWQSRQYSLQSQRPSSSSLQGGITGEISRSRGDGTGNPSWYSSMSQCQAPAGEALLFDWAHFSVAVWDTVSL